MKGGQLSLALWIFITNEDDDVWKFFQPVKQKLKDIITVGEQQI